jgi:hypothetical protein
VPGCVPSNCSDSQTAPSVYACRSSVALERPNENTFTFTLCAPHGFVDGDSGADVNALDGSGKSPLEVIVESTSGRGLAAVLALLCSPALDLSKVLPDGRTSADQPMSACAEAIAVEVWCHPVCHCLSRLRPHLCRTRTVAPCAPHCRADGNEGPVE